MAQIRHHDRGWSGTGKFHFALAIYYARKDLAVDLQCMRLVCIAGIYKTSLVSDILSCIAMAWISLQPVSGSLRSRSVFLFDSNTSRNSASTLW